VRIIVPLIEADSGDTSPGLLDDALALQDEITLCVVGAIEGVRKAEIQRVKCRRPESLDAYDLVLRAMPFVASHIADASGIALPEKTLRL
jgi:hypothetical protein